MKDRKPEELTPPEKRAEMLVQMRRTSADFYRQATQIGCHPFIEFCGLMNEYIKVCQQAHNAGIDFTNANAHSGHALPIQTYEAAYVGEKLGCIYGPALQKPEIGRAFLQAIGLDPHTHSGDAPVPEQTFLEATPEGGG